MNLTDNGNVIDKIKKSPSLDDDTFRYYVI